MGSATNVQERKSLEAEIKLRHREFVTLAEHSPDIISRFDPQLRYTYVNSAVAGVASHSADEHIGKTNWELGYDPAYCEVFERSCRQVMATHLQNSFDFSYQKPSGGMQYFHGRVVPEFAGTGSIESLLVIVSDVTDRKNAEETLKKTNLALQRSNEDLEQFAYTASHDLQEPLRTVSVYTELLERHLGSELQPKGAKFLATIKDASSRMLRLINDLLALSHAQSAELSISEMIPADDMVGEAVHNLKNAVSESGSLVSFSHLPSVWVDASQFRQVFQNLISNSIKYRKADEPPRIEISAERVEESWVFAVRDNGLGFDQSESERIFGRFNRLHGKEIPGTGIGQAIVKRIVERHDGQIWAESKPGGGATFYFRLPVAAKC